MPKNDLFGDAGAGEELSLGYLMHWGARLMRRLADRRLKPLGLSSAHLPVLNALIAQDELSQKALAGIAEIEQPTMAATLARMERDGIVLRRQDPNDKRSALYALTPATRKKIGAIRLMVETVNQEALHGLPAAQRAQFRRQLQTMILALEKKLAEKT